MDGDELVNTHIHTEKLGNRVRGWGGKQVILGDGSLSVAFAKRP